MAAIAALLLLAVTVSVFAKRNPFADRYEVSAVFQSGNQLRQGSAVRVAGLEIGTVREIEAAPDGHALVKMEIDDRSVPLRADARMAIEPRLLLEGNYYVEVSPGSPGERELPDGGTLPLAHTSVPVQIDQALGIFDAPTRRSLTGAIAEIGAGLGPAGGASGEIGIAHV